MVLLCFLGVKDSPAQAFSVINKSLYENLYALELCESDTAEVVLEHEIRFDYPELHSEDSKTDSLFNANIHYTVKSVYPNGFMANLDLFNPPVLDSVYPTCSDFIPFRTYLEYKTRYKTNTVVSFEFNFLDVACCGGNGSRGNTLFVTLDYTQKEELSLNNIAIDPNAVLLSLNQKLKNHFVAYSLDSTEYFLVDNISLPFGIVNGGISVAVESPYGQGSHNLEFVISWTNDEMKKLFNREFLTIE